MKNIVIGNYYRVRNAPCGWAKVLKILPARTGINTNRFPAAKCEWTLSKDDLASTGVTLGLIKYFKLSDLIEGKGKEER